MTRRSLLLAGLLLAAGLVVTLILTAPGPLDAARAEHDRIKVGMTRDEVDAILSVRFPEGRRGDEWLDKRSGATIYVEFGKEGQVIGKIFFEGDQSFHANVERLKGRLADRLHLGP